METADASRVRAGRAGAAQIGRKVATAKDQLGGPGVTGLFASYNH